MMTRRFVCCLLTLCLLVFMVPAAALTAEAEGPIDVTLSLYSNISPDRYISGLYDDNVFYITLEDLCELVDGTVTSRSDHQATISVGIREFNIDVRSGNMEEKLYSENYYVTMPSILKDGQIYISAMHFLRYIGATVRIDEQASIQFMVIKRYDIFNAIEDLAASESGNFFWWDEIDAKYGELEDTLVNAGIVALINRDSNIFRMMFDAKGMEREAVEDALLSIVKNEGAGYFDEGSKESELIDTTSGLIGAESDWFGLIKEAFQDTSELGEQINVLAENAAFTASFANNVVKAVESLKQFDNMSVTQKDLLATTILAHSNDSKTLNNQWGVVLDAARNVDAKIQSEYAAQIGAATQVAQSTAYDLMNGVTGEAGANPVSIAWNCAILLTKLIPSANQMIDRKDKLYNAYNCSIIQLIANEMLVDTYSDWYYSNGMYTNVVNQYEKLNTLKQLMILQLKSTLTTREYLIQSGFLEESYAEWMETVNQEIALLLNKTENCKITGVNMYEATYDDDISWMSKYNKPDYSNLVVDAYAKDCVYTAKMYNAETGKSEVTEMTCTFRIPQINLPGSDIEQVNAEIFNTLYPIIEDVVEEIAEYSHPFTSEEISYRWAVNSDILSLVVLSNSDPEVGGKDVYLVYNVSVVDGNRLSKNELISVAGVSQENYHDMLWQALGSAYFQGKESYIEQVGYDDFFRTQLENTLSEDNIQSCVPYFNEDGQLCIIGTIYSLAAADFYYHEINLENYVSNPAFSEYMEAKTNAANINSFAERYKEILLQHPESTPFTYGSKTIYIDTEYLVYDIDKDGTPELIVNEDRSNYYIYSFNGTDVVASDVCYWSYGDCLYEYEGNGIVVHDGGMGSLRFEFALLYSMMNNKLTRSERLMSTEEDSFEELYSFLDSLTPLNDFLPITDYSYLSN